jgi:hypothetical protein
MYLIFRFYLLCFPYVSNEILDLKNQLSCMSYIPLLFTPFFIRFKCHAWFEKPAFSHILYSAFIYSIFHMFQMASLIRKTSFSAYPILHFYFTLFSTCFKWHPSFEKPAFFHILYSTFYLLFSFWEACRWINNCHRIVRQSPSVVNWMLGWISSLRTLSNDTKASNIRLELQLENLSNDTKPSDKNYVHVWWNIIS